MLFSERKGYKPVRKVVQKDDIDDDLRCGLWNAIHAFILEKIKCRYNDDVLENSNLWILFRLYWHNYFKRPLDTIPYNSDNAFSEVRKYFHTCKWHEIYDFIEFTAQNAPDNLKETFKQFCNQVLERELSAYRFIENQITNITSEEEISSIEDALKSTSKFTGARTHLKTSLKLLSDRKSPDYRNSIKEAISAIESLSQSITEKPSSTLGEALNIIEKKRAIHPALKQALSSLYGYTSDADGIRHAMLEENNLTFVDAKFMLVSCTAFVNYLIGGMSNMK